jgi:hypothetical protein
MWEVRGGEARGRVVKKKKKKLLHIEALSRMMLMMATLPHSV